MRLLEASIDGDLDGMKRLLAAGANPNGADREHLPLLRAAMNGHATCVAALLAAGADPNVENNMGSTALHFAASMDRSEVVAALLAAGADPMATNFNVWTPLHHAAFRGRTCVLPLLLAAAPQAALAKDGAARTPLEAALVCGHMETARSLLELQLRPASEVLCLLVIYDSSLVRPLFATVVERQPLTASEWALVPAPCPCLVALLPFVLARSASEAALLVGHLLPTCKQRLRSAAMCLARAQEQLETPLPLPIVWRIMALSVG